jgi:GR25 family glycosyltransferase involved in LPS biosynthesis
MDLKNKLKNMPKVYYFNLDNRTDRKKYMEKQFDRWGINYQRVSGTKYLASKNKEWKHLIIDVKNYKLLVPIAANAISHLEFLKKWYEETTDPYVLLMEDDYD